MENPKQIQGLHDVDTKNVPHNEIRYIDIYFGGKCNLDCLYCFTNHNEGKLRTEDRKKLLSQAKSLGVESFVATGAGEPMLDSGFKEVIQYANDLGLNSIIYTNGNYIDGKMADFLYKNKVSPLVKLESLDPRIHDKITQRGGSCKKAMKAISNLLDVGYGEVKNGKTRIGVASVYNALNIDKFSELKEFCDKHGILFMADELGLEKDADKNRDELFVNKSKIDSIKSKLGIVESGIGTIYSDNKIATCNFADYGIRIDQDGNASYCTMQDLGDIAGNVLEKDLVRVISDVNIAKKVAIREKLKTINQVNEVLKRSNLKCSVNFPVGTCPFKAGDNLEIKLEKK